jgi:hypothetical protein
MYTYENVVLPFPHHREALQVKNLGGMNLCIRWSPYRVFSADVPLHLRAIINDKSASDHYPEEPASTYVNNYYHSASAIAVLCLIIC